MQYFILRIVEKVKKITDATEYSRLCFLRAPIVGGGGYIWPVMPIFELGWAIPVKSHVLKFGFDWLKSEVC